MTVPGGSETFRLHPLLSVVVLLLSGSIDRLQRDVPALIVLPHIRTGSVEGFAGGWQRKPSEREPQFFANLWSTQDDPAERTFVDEGQSRSKIRLERFS